jgi:hypothetical protein
MRKYMTPLMAFGALAFVAFGGLPETGIKPLHAQAPAQQDGPRAADADPAPFNPQLGALMAMIIQPRHAKLGLAGQAENWPMATYYFKELKQGFAVVAKAVPRWKGLPVPDLVEAALDQHWAVLDFSIKAGEPRQFGEAYGKITQGCNNCHTTMDHPFIQIKTPDASAWPNMEFKPSR